MEMQRGKNSQDKMKEKKKNKQMGRLIRPDHNIYYKTTTIK